MNTKVINLFGGPGTGKSTTSAEVFGLLKHAGKEVELVREFAKDLVWENSIQTLSDQLFISATQHHRMHVLQGKVEFIVTDSPILLGNVYSNEYEKLLSYLHNKFDNINFFLNRQKDFKQNGRLQTEDEAISLDTDIVKVLIKEEEEYTVVDADNRAAHKIVRGIINEYS